MALANVGGSNEHPRKLRRDPLVRVVRARARGACCLGVLGALGFGFEFEFESSSGSSSSRHTTHAQYAICEAEVRTSSR
jgi:hypothetical protein